MQFLAPWLSYILQYGFEIRHICIWLLVPQLINHIILDGIPESQFLLYKIFYMFHLKIKDNEEPITPP